MADCELQIQFDRDDPTYKAGEEVSGRVIAEVNEDMTCDALNLEAGWKTHGRGDQNTGTQLSLSPIVENDQWRAGETVQVGKAFKVPDDAPCSFWAGNNKIRWKVKAQVDIDNWPDWIDESRFIVSPRGTSAK